MSRVFNVSDDFGKLLLEGWAPSDQTCPAEGCCGIPLLRSPEGHNPVTWFCTSCKGDGTRSLVTGQSLSEQQHLSSPSLASSTHYSRSSTPPTEESHDPSSITFALPVETEESIRRRQQSDFASAEIGKRLLKGWAMLADECPRNTCYGVPLVRPPTAGRDKDPRKECVVCGTVYVAETEQKAQGRVPLAPGTLSGPSREAITSSTFVEGSSATTKGREKTSESPAVPAVVAPASPAVRISKVTHSTPAFPISSYSTRESNPPVPTPPSRRAFSEPISTSDDVLANSSKALEATLSALSQRLMHLSGQSILNPIAISQTVDATAKAGQALAVINTLRHNQE